MPWIVIYENFNFSGNSSGFCGGNGDKIGVWMRVVGLCVCAWWGPYPPVFAVRCS